MLFPRHDAERRAVPPSSYLLIRNPHEALPLGLGIDNSRSTLANGAAAVNIVWPESKRPDSISISHQVTDLRQGIPGGLVHIPGKRLQPLCRKLFIAFANAMVATRRFDGVVVRSEDAAALLDAIAKRECRSEMRRKRVERRDSLRRQEAERKEQRKADFRMRFPLAAEDTVDDFVDCGAIYTAIDDVPLNRMTAEEIDDLKLTKLENVGVFLADGGATVSKLFSAKLPDDTNEPPTDEEVYRQAVEINFGPQRALWAANKLLKLVDTWRKRELYKIKDELLQVWSEHLLEGRVVRVESHDCWSCNGSGGRRWGRECRRCFGTGYYSRRTLYECRYQFPDDGRVYCFHSYVQPSKLSNEPGVDKDAYGYRFSPKERRELPFGFYDLLRILRHEIVLRRAARGDHKEVEKETIVLNKTTT